MINFDKFSITGVNKPLNEDGLLHVQSANGVHYFAIADGLGGHGGGDIASSSALKVIATEVKKSKTVSFDSLFEKIIDKLETLSKSTDYSNLATTLTLLAIKDNGNGSIAHVGDCRVYAFSKESVFLLTKDQTEVQKLIDEGILNEKTSKSYRRKHVLLSALSVKKEYEIQKLRLNLDKGDKLMMVSDGFYNALDESIVAGVINSTSSARETAKKLEKIALKSNPKDDCSFWLISYKEDSEVDTKQFSMFNKA